ncbi:MAG: hypothetical protein WD066_07735 [Planctomycetaceae bacterium]
MFRRILFAAACLFALGIAGPAMPSAEACPMCKAANETDDRLPRAYMASILFMLAMPATLVTGFGFAFWRLSKKQEALLAASEERPEEPFADDWR